MTKENFKKGLIGLGIGIIATGIVAYFVGQKNYMTWEEMLATVDAYNQKIEEIKKDCDNDVRCIGKDGMPKVIFQGVKNKKDVLDRMNEWIEDDANNPKTYKKI